MLPRIFIGLLLLLTYATVPILVVVASNKDDPVSYKPSPLLDDLEDQNQYVGDTLPESSKELNETPVEGVTFPGEPAVVAGQPAITDKQDAAESVVQEASLTTEAPVIEVDRNEQHVNDLPSSKNSQEAPFELPESEEGNFVVQEPVKRTDELPETTEAPTFEQSDEIEPLSKEIPITTEISPSTVEGLEHDSDEIDHSPSANHESVTVTTVPDTSTEAPVVNLDEPSTEKTPTPVVTGVLSFGKDVVEPILKEEAVTTEGPSVDSTPSEQPYDPLNILVLTSNPKTPDTMEMREQEILHEVISGKVDKKKESSESNPLTEGHLSHLEEQPMEELPEEVSEHEHHDHGHHSHHHHHHTHDFFKESNDSSSFMLVIKHLSSTMLSFLPEPLQDTILDVDDALVFTGIIALTLVSICVPYFLIEGYMSVRPLKKKVVELNKSLWKVSAAYETQQEEFEIFKQKAIAHDEYKKRAEQSENDVLILKKLETKHREQITALKTQLKSQMKEAVDIRALIEKTLEDKKTVSEECGKYKAAFEKSKEALAKTKEELASFQNHAKSSALQLGVSSKNVEMLTTKISLLEKEMEEIKSQLDSEIEKRKTVEREKQEVEQCKQTVEKELAEIKNICIQYESTVSELNDEISKLESELTTIKETLGEDSPLLEVAEVQAKAAFSVKEANSLRTRLEGLSADNENLREKLRETTTTLEETRSEKEITNNRLQVLEKYFKEREEEYIKTIEQLQLKESVRDKGKEELIRIIEEKENVCKDLSERLEALKEEFEETKQQHRNEIRSLEAKGHENWLSLCQAERKAQDARKEAELLRQRLTVMSKEKDDEDGDGLNGEVPIFPVIPHELVPLPILDEPPSYFGLGDFVPPPPLPEGEEREPHRPPPLGGRLSPSFSDFDDNILSPIGGVGRREDDCTDGSSGSNSPRRSPPLRGGWPNHQHDRGGQGRESIRRLSRATSSPIQPGANL